MTRHLETPHGDSTERQPRGEKGNAHVVRRSQWQGGPVTTAHGGLWDLGASRHYHRVPGVWDSDNGPIAGKVCHSCWEANCEVSVAAVVEASQ